MEKLKPDNARIGIFAGAHATYWEQFEGLYESIMGYHRDFCNKVSSNGVTVIDFGMVDSSEKSYETLEKMKGERLDLIFCNMVTYATSSVFAPIMRDIGLPVVLAYGTRA